MSTHRLELPDWRNNVNGLPLAAFDGSSIKRVGSGDKTGREDLIIRSAVEGINDRPSQTPRPGAEQ